MNILLTAFAKSNYILCFQILSVCFVRHQFQCHFNFIEKDVFKTFLTKHFELKLSSCPQFDKILIIETAINRYDGDQEILLRIIDMADYIVKVQSLKMIDCKGGLFGFKCCCRSFEFWKDLLALFAVMVRQKNHFLCTFFPF